MLALTTVVCLSRKGTTIETVWPFSESTVFWDRLGLGHFRQPALGSTSIRADAKCTSSLYHLSDAAFDHAEPYKTFGARQDRLLW